MLLSMLSKALHYTVAIVLIIFSILRILVFLGLWVARGALLPIELIEGGDHEENHQKWYSCVL